MKKKLLSYLMAAAMVGGLTACGSPAAPAPSQEGQEARESAAVQETGT